MAKVYAIRNRTSDLVYVGSTTLTLEKRFQRHKHHKDCSAVQVLTCPTAYIELLEECDVEVRKERERFWIENTPNCVNINNPFPDMTRSERDRDYYLRHKDEHNARSRQYYIEHRAERLEYLRQWRMKRKLTGGS